MDLDIAFAGKTMTTPLYIKVDPEEHLLLSEGVCQQLGIIRYHPDVEPWRRQKNSAIVPAGSDGPINPPILGAVIPMISIKLVKSLCLPPVQCAVIPVQVEGGKDGASLLLESTAAFKRESGLELSDILLKSPADGQTQAVVVNTSGFTQQVASGTMEMTLAWNHHLRS